MDKNQNSMKSMNSVEPRKRGRLIFKITCMIILSIWVFSTGYSYGVASTKPVIVPFVTLKPTSQKNPIKTISTPLPSVTVPQDWKTYTNTKYGYSVKYPPTLVASGSSETINSTNHVYFDFPEPHFGIPPYTISLYSYPKTSIDKVFSLEVGEELDKKTAKDLGSGSWDFPTKFQRLPDEIVDGVDFRVLENPQWYGGANRILFLEKDGLIFTTRTTYTQPEQLLEFKQFYSSLRFTNTK